MALYLKVINLLKNLAKELKWFNFNKQSTDGVTVLNSVQDQYEVN